MHLSIGDYVTDPNEQRMNALAQAQEVRLTRAKERRAMTIDRACEIIRSQPAWALTWAIDDLIDALPGYGVVKSGELLSRAGVASGRTIEWLTERQRDALIGELRKGRV